ncbi:short chain dehydrogenase [Mucilaginibacter sp. X4EP1]|uniref:short chain dehydrogenase n=1 Tax=Mucilaginibacter sp. X4EP1 TaxID=2723092 RepID=UPI00216A491D|nr:short chain dehydrogenase [Mucilaginibacter sp. X4EP1]MCS3813529.1 NAD(P)-dependent dehydrogenase (short-subunit alcohol dehydrogenase family) [Mucilaginibacter sp. X4EP1]
MKILIIGASGLIGGAIYNALKNEHEVFGAYRTSSEYPVDTTNAASIRSLFERLPKLDAVINAAGAAPFKPFETLTEDDYYEGIKDKLMGQVNLVHIAKDHLNPGASITLTTGILADHPEKGSTALALVNGALHSFVMAAAPFIDNNIRINVVAPGSIGNHMAENELFAGHKAVAIDAVIEVYKEALFGSQTGQVFRIY